jgi:hypothetical protein
MASTDILDSANDLSKFMSKLCGNASMFRLLRRSISFSSDANKTLTSSEYDAPILDIGSGTTLTATRNLVLPLTDGAVVFVNNQSTGGQSVQVIGSTGTGITIATAKAALLWCDGTNWKRMSADVTV